MFNKTQSLILILWHVALKKITDMNSKLNAQNLIFPFYRTNKLPYMSRPENLSHLGKQTIIVMIITFQKRIFVSANSNFR